MKAFLTPHVTEKSYATIPEDAKAVATYTFRVPRQARKDQVKSAVESAFKVVVEDVRIHTLPGKARRFKGVPGRTAMRRKAIVRLKAGQRIALFDLPKEEAPEAKA